MRTLFQKLGKCIQSKEDTVLVSIIASEGSAPRGAGAHMLVGADGRICGTVGGGAIEGKCIDMAKKILHDRISYSATFSLNDIRDEELGMVCGGAVRIFFQYLSYEEENVKDVVKAAKRLFEQGKSTWLVLNLTDGTMSLCCETHIFGNAVPKELTNYMGKRPQIAELSGKQFYTEWMIRNGRVYLFGGGHVAQALVPVLYSVDFRCVVVEDREEFCDPYLFPKAEGIRLMQPPQWRRELPIGEEDYICIMTRGHKNDLECQVFALETDACYIGVIGSRRKIAVTQAKLKERGFSEEDLKRITTPIGLEIGAETPAEIAVSIAAQLIAHRAARMQMVNPDK